MKLLRALLAIAFGFIAAILCWGSALLTAINVFESNRPKDPSEWPLTLIFAALSATFGGIAATAAWHLLEGRDRTRFLLIIVPSAVAAWGFIVIHFWQVEPAYLWLIIGVPVVLSLIILRVTRTERRKTAA